MASTNFVVKNGLTVASGTVVAGGSSGTNGQVLASTGTGVQWVNAATGTGDVTGPSPATDNAVTRFDTTSGKLIQSSTVTLDDNGNFNNVNSVVLDTTPATLPTSAGTLYWEDGEGTPEVILKGGNTTLKVGAQEYARVYNDSGSTITLGQAVYISGAQGNRVAVKLAQANTEANSFGTLGLVAETIANGAEGWIIVSGALYKLNTLGLTAGAVVYLSPTTAGAYTTTKPQAPDQLVVLGFIERVSSTVGSIYVKVDNGYELDELHDVRITSPISGNTLIYDATTSPTGVWKNASLTAGTGVSVTNGAGSITIGLGTVPVANGGTGSTTLASGSYLVGNGTSAVTLKTPTQVTADLDLFTYQIGGFAGKKGLVPAAPPVGGPETIVYLDNSGGWSTPSGGGTTTNALTIQSPLTGTSFNGSTAVTIGLGTVAVGNGGTGLTTLTAGYIPYGNGTSAFGSSANLFWDSTNSRLGVGTSSPASKLMISGTGTGAWFTVNRTDSGTNIIDFTQSGSRLGYVGYNGNDLYLNQASAANTIFFTNSTERMRITSGGSVGIANSSPQSLLHIGGDGNATITTSYDTQFNHYYSSWGANATRPYLRKAWNATVNDYLYLGATGNGSNTAMGAIFLSNVVPFSCGYGSNTADGLSNEFLRVTNTGNVGIGISSPAYKLDINGNARTTGRFYSNEWVQFDNYTGIYSPINSAYIYPNPNSYGSWKVEGQRNGWCGLEFATTSNGNISLMIQPDAGTSGFHNNSVGWQFRWNVGTLYCHKGTYGGGTIATVLDSSNYSSYAPTLTGGNASGTWGINVTGSTVMVDRGSVTTANIDNATGNGFYIQQNSGDSHSVLVFNPFGSTAVVQQRFHYTGTMEFRNKTDSANWQPWKTVLTSANYSSYALPLSGGTITGSIYATSNNSGGEFYSYGWFRNYNSGTGIYNQATGNHFYSDGGYWNVAYGGTQGIRFRNGHAGAILGYLYAETNGNIGLLSNNGNWSVRVLPSDAGVTLYGTEVNVNQTLFVHEAANRTRVPRTFVQSSTPTGTLTNGDIWIQF